MRKSIPWKMRFTDFPEFDCEQSLAAEMSRMKIWSVLPMKAEMVVSTVSEKHTKGSSEKWLAKAPPEVHRYVLQKKNDTRFWANKPYIWGKGRRNSKSCHRLCTSRPVSIRITAEGIPSVTFCSVATVKGKELSKRQPIFHWMLWGGYQAQCFCVTEQKARRWSPNRGACGP